MRTHLKALVAAAALALAPMGASALTLSPSNDIVDGQTGIDILAGPYFFDSDFGAGDASGTFTFGFTNTSSSSQTVGTVVGTILQSSLDFLGGVTIGWANGTSVFVPEGATAAFSASSLSTLPAVVTTIAAGASDTLTVNYGSVVDTGRAGGRADIDFTVSAVPLPAGGLLLLGALGGAAALRRRKKAAAPVAA